MNHAERFFVERTIVRKVVHGLLAAGYNVSVWYEDDDEAVVCKSTDAEAIFNGMFDDGGFFVDEERLDVERERDDGITEHGWVLFIHGNAEDVLSDFTENLSCTLDPINESLLDDRPVS